MKLYYKQYRNVFFEQQSFTEKEDIHFNKRTHGVQTQIWMDYQTSMSPDSILHSFWTEVLRASDDFIQETE